MVLSGTVMTPTKSTTWTFANAMRDGVATRFRPVLMRALMAAIGLMPAALSTGIGSEHLNL